MRVAVISANLGAGGYDPPNDWPEQLVPSGTQVVYRRLTDETCPPRPLAMTSRLQCGIPKWFGPDFAAADVYLWIDASCAPTDIAVTWFLRHLGDADIAVFAHPERKTIADEYEFMRTRMERKGETYLNSRYKGEWLDQQFHAVNINQFKPLYASTAFMYRPRQRVLSAFREVFLMKARYLLHDQLAFSHCLHQHECVIRVIPDNYLKCDALAFTRKMKATA